MEPEDVIDRGRGDAAGSSPMRAIAEPMMRCSAARSSVVV